MYMYMHGISGALLGCMRHFSAGSFNAAVCRGGQASNLDVEYLDSNPDRGWNFYNN